MIQCYILNSNALPAKELLTQFPTSLLQAIQQTLHLLTLKDALRTANLLIILNVGIQGSLNNLWHS